MAMSTARAALHGILGALSIVTKRLVLLVGGIVAGALLAFSLDSSSGIPPGKYTPLKILGGISLQINLDSIVIDDASGAATFWIREDREGPFLTETGMMGRTVFTKVIVDCKKEVIKIGEQRAFDMNMNMVAVRNGGSVMFPNSLMTTVVIMGVCGKLPDLESAPKA